MKKFGGYVIENHYPVKYQFVCFGEMIDGTHCYHKLDDNGNEIEGEWYSMSRWSGHNIFTMEGVE